jgi:hypothetical protein
MEIQLSKDINDYLKATEDTYNAFKLRDDPIFSIVSDLHNYITHILEQGFVNQRPIPVMLSMNSYMNYMASVRVAMSGHSSAVFPILRSSLESACYSYLMTQHDNLEQVWLERHAGPLQMKACRDAFSSAVKDVARTLNEKHGQPEGWINEAYQSTIDYGAHPNVKSIMDHIQVDNKKYDDLVEIRLAGVYSADHVMARRSLLACCDIGVVLALIITATDFSVTELFVPRLQDINDRKNQLAHQEFDA